MKTIYLSVIIPGYNESKRIGTTLASLEEYFKDKTYTYEIIFVDDGSEDNTVQVVRNFARRMPALRVIRSLKNQGKGHAVKKGMEAAQGQYRLFMDADNSVHIRTIEKFFKHIENGHEVVIGSIALKDADVKERNGSYRRILGSLSKWLIRHVATPGIYDTQRGFKLFTERAANILFPKQTITRFGFDIELLVMAQAHNLPIKELPVAWDNPPGSTVELIAYASTFADLTKILYRKFFGYYRVPKYEREPQALPAIPAHKRPAAFRGGYVMNYAAPLLNIKPDEEVHLRPFSKEQEILRGKGFHYKGKEFVHHTDLHHNETAFKNLLLHQKWILVAIAGAIIGSLLADWRTALITFIAVLTAVYFLDLLFNAYLVYASLKRRPEIAVTKEEIAALDTASLPTYTIFCPLYREWQVVPQFVDAMNGLDYPKEKLQIVLLLEENDQETIDKVKAATLPAHFEVVIVPHSMPKTKPKAMNYGLRFARGEYLVIYDAEDVPEGDQLKKAVASFAKVSPEIICIQAKLNFYNVHQNLLTKIFTAEYSLWYDLVLPGLQSLHCPIPLGGTSNHFKTSVLRELFGWDAFNVTEDCDLGMRLAKRGYRTAIVESTTHEEANSDIRNWYNQRSRWIKGYIQTYFVHMRQPSRFAKEGSWKDMFIFQFIVGGKILSMFINPLMWVITIFYFVFRAKAAPIIDPFFPGPVLYLGVMSFVFGNFLYLLYYMIGCAKRGYDHLIKYAFLVPLYWIAMSIAAWRAVYEVIVKPHYWSKTLHGLHLRQPSPANA